jgi:predicted phage baseplate assembly protein
LFEAKQDDRVYVVRHTDEGDTSVTFGDGRRGARLPTGRDNVGVRYRKGIGRDGLVRARQLSLLLSRPLGVKAATNPRATEGAEDPQRLDDARLNAPLTVLTLDRAVSLQDYEDFARAFSGIARAHAVWTWEVNARGVFLTVAGTDGAVPSEDGETVLKLARALREFGNPLASVRVRGYRPIAFALAATVSVMPDRDPEQVLAAVKNALATEYAFAQRDFGEPVTLAEVTATMQRVPGVDSVDVTALHRGAPGVEPMIVPETPRSGSSGSEAQLKPAELITLDPASLGDVTLRTQ